VRQLTRAAYAKWIPVIGREPKPMTADYEDAVVNHWIDLLEIEGQLAGLVEMIHGDGFLIIENLAVAEARQGQGLGQQLLSYAEHVARSNGFSEVRLYTNAAFASNVAFYHRRDYHEVGRTPLPDGGTMVHFSKEVSNP
jgi:GNAT superfamily N-acetyltransferase